MEKRSARILALILALIMLGSVFAYMSKGGGGQKRDVELRLNDFREYFNITPDGAYYCEYVNLSYLYLDQNDPLRNYVDERVRGILRGDVFSRSIIEIPSGFTQILAVYYDTPLYFIDENRSKVYFAFEDQIEHGNHTIKVRPGLALLDSISPIALGFPSNVEKVADILDGKSSGVSNRIYPYLSRINGSFYYAWLVYGDNAKQLLKDNNTGITDFFFEGYRFNETNKSYEKVWGLHFLGNYFFARTNQTEYNIIENYNDGFSVAILGDKNFTKLIQTQPRILSYQISFETPKNETGS
jgi:hypothetical protein